MKEKPCPSGERKLNPLLWRISSDISVLLAKYFLAEFLFYMPWVFCELQCCLQLWWASEVLLQPRQALLSLVQPVEHKHALNTATQLTPVDWSCGVFFKKKEKSTRDSSNWKIRVLHLCSVVTHPLGKVIPMFYRFHPYLFFLIYSSKFSILIPSDFFCC